MTDSADWDNMQTGKMKTEASFMEKKRNSAEFRLLSGLFFRLLPYQVLLIVINAVNWIVDSLYASNAIGDGKSAMSAIGLFGPFNHFLYAASI